MARILGEDGRVYYSLSIDTFVEPDIQTQIQSKSRIIFPGFTYVPCSPLIVSDTDARKPDFILVENSFRSWWIGEVEKSHHSLRSHVIPQVDTFRNGYYDSKHVSAILEACPDLDESRLSMLIHNEAPRVLVVVDKLNSDWETMLEGRDAKVALFEIFRSQCHRYIFRLNGYAPVVHDSFSATCRCQMSMPNLLHVTSPSGFPLSPGRIMSILFEGVCMDWKVIEAEEVFWLRPLGIHALSVNKEYVLTINQDETYELRSKSQ